MYRTCFLKPAFVVAFLVFASVESAGAATLVLVDWAACSPCRRFHREVEPNYAGSLAGQIAPLRRIDVLTKWPDDLQGIARVNAAPYFILLNDGREIGRFSGNSGHNLFWRNLYNLLSEVYFGLY